MYIYWQSIGPNLRPTNWKSHPWPILMKQQHHIYGPEKQATTMTSSQKSKSDCHDYTKISIQTLALYYFRCRFRSRRAPYPNSASGLILFCNGFRPQRVINFMDFNGFEFSNHATCPLRSLPFLGCYFALPIQKQNLIYMANPNTKQITILPRPSSMSDCHAYGPGKSPHSFKVVCIRTSGCIKKPCQIEIYSSHTCHWKFSGGFFQLTSLYITFITF